MKFCLTIINRDPDIQIHVEADPSTGERIQLIGRNCIDYTERQAHKDAETIIDIEQTLERLLGVRVHLSEAE